MRFVKLVVFQMNLLSLDVKVKLELKEMCLHFHYGFNVKLRHQKNL